MITSQMLMRPMNLLKQLSGTDGHGQYKHYHDFWCKRPSQVKSVYAAAALSIPRDVEDRDTRVALECERIAADPKLIEQAMSDYPPAKASKMFRDQNMGAAR